MNIRCPLIFLKQWTRQHAFTAATHTPFPESDKQHTLNFCPGLQCKPFAGTIFHVHILQGHPAAATAAVALRLSKYKGGIDQISGISRWLEEILLRMETSQRRSFRKFVTGADRAPIGDLACVVLPRQEIGPDLQPLHTASDCFKFLVATRVFTRGTPAVQVGECRSARGCWILSSMV